jgi:predicted DNA-binding transcriptional regulator YafY
MANPTTRVLAVLELLQNHRRISGAELAERLGVDRRTVRRYIAVLEELGVPVTTEQGRYGGYMLVPGFKLPPMMFTDEEALAISLGLLAARELGVAQATPAIDSVETKLERVMPDVLKRRVRGVKETTKLLFPPADTPQDERALITLTRAIEAEQGVSFAYQAPEQPVTQRDVDPYGLTFWNGHWYLSGFCHLRQALRSFRLDRIHKVQALTRHFQRPDKFDSAEHLVHSLRSFQRNYEVSVVLHTDEETAAKAFGLCSTSSDCFQAHADGLLLNTHTDSIEWFARWLAYLPFSFAVLGPPELEQALGQLADRLLRASQI